MPALPGYIAVALASAGATTAAVIVANITISQIITAALVINGLMRARKARKGSGAALEQNLADRTFTLRSAVAPREIVYGRARIGCVFIRKPFTSGEHSQFLHMQLALRAGHEVESIDDIWFGDESIGPLNSGGEVTTGRYFKMRTQRGVWSGIVPGNGRITLDHAPSGIDSIAGGIAPVPGQPDASYYQMITGATVSGQVVEMPPGHAGKAITITYQYVSGVPMVSVRRFTGSAFGERDEWLEEKSGGVWKPTHLGKGVPRLHITLAYDQDVFPSGVPEVTAIVKGKRAILDTRTGVTLPWSDNAALCARDYLVDELGFAENPTYINAVALSAAANVCDESIPTATGSQNRYTCNGVLSTADNRLDNLALIATSMVGNAVYTGGEWLVQAGAYSAPVMDLSDDDLAEGAIELMTETPTRDIFNSVRGKIIDPARGYQEVEFPPYDSAVYIAEDGERISQDVALPMTDDATRAQRIAKMILHVSRQSMGISATFSDKAARLRPGETVRLTIGIFGHDAKTFRIIDRRFRFPGVVRLVMQETSPAPYAWNYAEAKDYDPTPNTILPRPWFVPALANMQVASGSSYTRLMQDGKRQAFLRATWDQTIDVGVLHGGKIEVYIKRAIATEYDQFELDGSDTAFEYDVADEETYNIAIRARNGSNVRGNYTIATHTVEGAYIAPQGINYLGEFATHPTSGLTEGAIYRNSLTKDTYIYSGAVWSVFLESGEDGAPGTAKLLNLTATSQVFAVATAGAGAPASIVLTAQGQNLAGSPVFTVTSGTVTGGLLGSGMTRTLNFAAMATETVTIAAEQDGQRDQLTIVKVHDGVSGADAINALLTNEAHTLAAAPDGTVPSYASALTRMLIYEGRADVTAAWTFAKVDSGGVVSVLVTSGADRGMVTIQSMTADSGFVTISATRAGYPAQEKRFAVAKSRQGVIGPAGTSAKLLVLNASSQLVQIAKTGALSPASITFTAVSQNLTGSPVFTVAVGTATLTGTGSTRTMAASSLSGDSVTVRVTQDGQSDESTVIKLREGSDAVTCLLTNEAHTVAADSAGVVSSWAGVQTDMDVYVGLVDDGINWSFTQAASNITATLNNTPGSADRGRLVVTAMPTAATSGYVDITATKAGFPSQTKRFVVAKSRQGTGGAVGPSGVRGSAHVYLSGYTAWSQAPVDAYFAATYGGKVANDVVTVYGAGFSQTRLWTGSTWQQVTVALDGSLLVVGSTPGDRVTPGTITGDRNLTPPVGGLSVTPDPGFEDLSLWTLSGSAARILSTPWGKFGRYAIFATGLSTTDEAEVIGRNVPIALGKKYRASALMSNFSSQNRLSGLHVSFFKADNDSAYGGAGWLYSYAQKHFFGLFARNPEGSEKEFSIVFGPGTGVDIPADATQMAIGCAIHMNDDQPRYGNNSVSGLRIQVVSDTELIAPYAATNVLSTASVAGLIPAVADYTILSLVVTNPSDQDAEVSVAGGFNAGSDQNAWIVGNLQADGGISGSTGTSLADRQQVPISVSGRRTLAAKASITVYLRVTIRVPGDPEGSGGIRVSEGVVGNGTYSYAFLRAELIKR